MARPRVVVVGGGFGGLAAARALRRAPVDVTLLDRTNHHLFQPLLYQVAMAGLAPGEIATPIRQILRRQRNATVLLAEVTRVDLACKVLTLADGEMAWDYLVLATGARTSYLGHDAWERHAPGLKSLRDAIEIRERVLQAFELAEREDDPARRSALMTFVVIGGGPTGVELAGTLGEVARHALRREFRRIEPARARIFLLEGGPRILAAFPERLSARATRHLGELGVEVRTGAFVAEITPEGVRLADEVLPAGTVLWAAGIQATSLTATLGVPLDKGGRVLVEPDLSVPGHPDAFVIGDASSVMSGGRPVPGVAPAAVQMGRFAGRVIARSIAGRPRGEFRYVDKGNLATIGRSRAVAAFGRIGLSGLAAWVAWLAIHLFFLIGFRNRLAVMLQWAWSYFTFQRGDRLIVGRVRAGPVERPIDRPSRV